MAIYFISDLHLEPGRAAMTRGFLNFLDNLTDAEALYILGDFFEVWIGDDLRLPFTDEVEGALRALAARDCKIFIMHGNRDFLLGNEFCKRASASLISEGIQVELGKHSALLLHGDSLCTGDTEYMKVRAMFRSPAWQQQILSKTIEERIAFARQVRDESQRKGQMASTDIMDVTQAEVDRVMNESGIDTLIHGHTHRPAVHQWVNEQGEKTRLVLGDWSDNSGWMIRWSPDTSLVLSQFEF